MRITPTLDIDETELEERFVRASGPGGQNVNKVSTAVELRFNLAANRSIPGARVALMPWVTLAAFLPLGFALWRRNRA